ncbi:MAG: histidine phosphatase family protein [Isosphaeraceae bacterium]
MIENDSTFLYLLRHGATLANQERPYRLQGRRSDLPLEPIGLEQARRAATALTKVNLTAVYSSPALRALETAREIGRARSLEPIPLEPLNEADVGLWEGMTWSEIEKSDPERHRQFMTDPGTVPYPGGESFLDVQQRVYPAMKTLARQHKGERIAVVGHNVVNRAYLAQILRLPIQQARAIRQANGGVNLVVYRSEGPTVVTLNACLHLEDLGPNE